MQTYPSGLEEKLGFDVIRRRVAERVRSQLGLDRLEATQPATDLERLRAELQRVAEWAEAEAYDKVVPLQHVLDLRGALRRAQPQDAYLDPEDLKAVRLVQITLRRTQDYFSRRAGDYPRLAERAKSITPTQDLEQRIASIIDEDARIRDDASAALLGLRQRIAEREGALRETLRRALREAQRQGYATEEQPTLRGGRMVIPIRAEAKRKVEGFVHDTSATGQTVYIEPAASLDLNNEIRELRSEERREIERILREATAHVRRHLDGLKRNQRILAHLDLLQAKARLTNALDAVVPEVSDRGIICLHEGRNPVLQLHFRQQAKQSGGAARSVVPLDVALGETYRTLVITGPNAGGKTVAMKTVGLLALMLAHGLPIPAAPHTRFDLFERLIVDIGDEQSIEEDLSTFSSHVANLRHMLEKADGRSLVLIDEAGTGTDPGEGGALAQAVLERLTEKGARTIATTHHGTLKAYAHEAERVENGSMEFDQETLRPTYRFRAGVPGSSYAFEIAQRMGLSGKILGRARALAGEKKTALEDLIATFEARNQALQEELDAARAEKASAEKARARYEGRAEKIQKEKEKIRQQALEEAERIVQGANARIEQVIREIKETEAEKEATRQAREAFEDYREDVKEQRARDEAPPEENGREAAAPPAGDGQPAARPDRQPGAPIAEGDQVVLDGGNATMEVEEISGDEAVVVAGAMHLRVDLSRLTKVGGRREQQVTVSGGRGSGGGAELSALKAERRLDLRGQRVEEARKALQDFLDEAVAADLQKVEILHGKGTGALRQFVHEYLEARAEVTGYDDAPWDQGGTGVTHAALA